RVLFRSVAGAGTGVVEASKVLGPERVATGDVLVAMASSGLHSNGYSLARHVLLGDDGAELTTHVAELGRTLGEELLEPTRIYAQDCLALSDELGQGLHALSHITGGGIAANIARVLPADRTAVIDRTTWTPAPIFELIGQRGGIAQADLELTFNMGLGMVAVVAAEASEAAVHLLTSRGVNAWAVGGVRRREAGEHGDAEAKGGQGGAAVLSGAYRPSSVRG
ncbi:MAG: phosphoribosylformylglycinamidine cyclo-ligase, partial [Actinomycetota bacterium]|nr:phosphoribosylformylglycinamidine cyclo-ligase [Actinomycetota bacterium]